MAVTVYVNGTAFSFPETNDTQWGDEVTSWAQAISAGTIQATGGTFALTRDLNLGVANGIIVQVIQTPQINATANLVLTAGSKIDLNTASVRFLSSGVYYTLQGLLANSSTSFDTANAAYSHSNGAFVQANTATTNADAAFAHSNAAFVLATAAYANSNTAIYTAAQIRANVSNAAPINYDSSTGIFTHALSGVTATGYGSATVVPVFVVNDKGHVTSVTNTTIAIATANVSESAGGPFYFTAAKVRSNVSNTAPINYDSSTGIFSFAVSGVTASGYGDAAAVPKVVVNAKGLVTSVTNTSIAIAASAITSGTLVVARGGTGQTAITVNGCMLIGNTVSSGFDVNTLTPGNGITIINGKGTAQVNANCGIVAGTYDTSSSFGSTSIADGWYRISFGTKRFDISSNYDTSTKVLTPSRAGLITIATNYKFSKSNGTCQLRIMKNSSTVIGLTSLLLANSISVMTQGISLTVLDSATATDNYAFEIYENNGASPGSINSANNYCSFIMHT